jgi:hypothetical protein
MTWTVTFYDRRVEAEILAFSSGFLARFLQYAERMEMFGPDLGMPHTRAMGSGLFELRKGRERNCAGVLLHSGRSPDRLPSPVREKD